MDKTRELIAAPYTPFNAAGELKTDLISGYASYLKERGVRGVFVTIPVRRVFLNHFWTRCSSLEANQNEVPGVFPW